MVQAIAIHRNAAIDETGSTILKSSLHFPEVYARWRLVTRAKTLDEMFGSKMIDLATLLVASGHSIKRIKVSSIPSFNLIVRQGIHHAVPETVAEQNLI